MNQPPTNQQREALRPLAAVIEHAIQNTPIRLGSDDWGTMLAAQLLADVSVYMGRQLGPDAAVLAEVQAERERQDAKWGEQNHPDGTGSKAQQAQAEASRKWCQDAFASGYGTWADVLAEEVAEANAESDPAKLRAELVQVAAVAAAWIAAIDRRAAAAAAPAVPTTTKDGAAAPQPEPPVHGESVAHLAGLHDDEPAVDARQDGAPS